METNQGEGNKKLYIGIIVLLLLLNCGTLYLYLTTSKAKTDLGEQKVALENDFKALSDTLDSKKMELEQFKGKNAELDAEITAKQEEIDNQKKTIAGLFAKGKMTGKELADAKAKIAEFEASVSDLKKRLEELTEQNQQLTNQNQQLSTDLSSEKQTTSKLSEENQGLSKKVELGSLLQLKNLEVTAIKKKSNGKEVTVNRVKQVESLRIAFETGENKVLDAGNLSLYVRIINPKGETISVADQGSGTLKLADGQDVQYSKKADFDYAQSNKKISVYWSQNITSPGTYKVEVYQSGYAIGLGQVELK
jgi:predicted  nucleic acid-binding Zn-ribbon protein